MKKNIFIAQEMHLTGFDYIFTAEDIVETGQTHDLHSEDIYSHSYLLNRWAKFICHTQLN